MEQEADATDGVALSYAIRTLEREVHKRDGQDVPVRFQVGEYVVIILGRWDVGQVGPRAHLMRPRGSQPGRSIMRLWHDNLCTIQDTEGMLYQGPFSKVSAVDFRLPKATGNLGI